MPGQFLRVPIGDSEMDYEPPKELLTTVQNRFRQQNRDYCLPYCIAGCLQYMGHHMQALEFARSAGGWTGLPGNYVLTKVREKIMKVLPQIAQPLVYNRPKRRTRKVTRMTSDNLVTFPDPYMTLVHPIGNDGSCDHAICVVDDLIFDARLDVALKLCKESLDWVCGKQGMDSLGEVFCFRKPFGVKPVRVERQMKTNW